MQQCNFQPTFEMANTLYETRLQGIMGIVFIILDWIFVLMNSVTNDVQQVRRWLYYCVIIIISVVSNNSNNNNNNKIFCKKKATSHLEGIGH